MQNWPPMPGDYKVLEEESKVAIVTLTSNPEDFGIPEAAIVGSLKTENLGIERIIANIISNPKIRAFILCGKESQGHYAGQALLSVWKNGADKDMKIIDAKGPIPYLENITQEAVKRFQRQIVLMEDLIGELDTEVVRAKTIEINAMRFSEFNEESMQAASRKESKKIAVSGAENMLVLPGGFVVDPVSFSIKQVV
ncbi:MAG: tetrahydromethanopterin S-methyltransferase subunit A [Candidatus Aenigmarchaeota archaeon]|nr:tetrahydromethanopterin S-methyltransferase subunit A [Candidatus Aenigmarchaeota archaeon]